ncbi:MAG: DUF3987 domain-containing protein [Armatimonadetes bacterium]|nr:DUF3987 domain-containing protein [Armatimonadota bacterium]
MAIRPQFTSAPDRTALPDRDAVLDALSGDFLGFYGQYLDMRRAGREYVCRCPFHDEKTPSFHVNPDTGLYKCFGCGDGGDVFRFLERLENLTFPEALARAASYAGLSVAAAGPSRNGSNVSHHARNGHSGRDSPQEAVPAKPLDPALAEECHRRLMENDRVRSWLADHRGLSTETLTRFQIGLVKDEQGHWRVTFPVKDAQGHLLNIRRHLFAYKEGLDRANKTLPWAKGLPAGLFPLAAIEDAPDVTLVEGEADACLANQLGLAAVTGTLGAGNWKPEWTEALRGAQRVTVLYDADESGAAGAVKAADALLGAVPDVRIARLPSGQGKDLTEWIVTHGAAADDVRRVLDAATPHRRERPATSGGWEQPVPFTARVVPPFPMEALADALRGYAASVADTLQVPPDLPALLGLAACAAAAARSCRVQVGTTHAEPMNVYIGIGMESGNRKSAAMEAMAFPLREAESERLREARAAIEEAKERRAVQEKRQAVLRDQAAKAKDAAERDALMRELGELASDLIDVPAAPRLLADDVTQEQAATLLAEQGGCLAIFSAEGGIFNILAGRYSQAGVNLDLFLKAHSGDPYRVDRKGRPAEHIARPALTLALAVQPDVLQSLSDTPAFRRRGLLGRLLYALPDSLVGTRLYDGGRAVDEAARLRYGRTVRALLDLPSPATPEDPGARHTLTLTGRALSVWAEYADAVERRQADGGDLAGVRDWASKLAGGVARLAGILHMVEHVGGTCPWTAPISPATVAAAWAIGEYLIPHALAAFGLMGADPRLALAKRVLGWIERTGQTAFTLRDCHQAHRGLTEITTPADLLPALEVLEGRGYVRAEATPHTGSGRKPGPLYRVNPYAQNPQNTQN